MYQMFRGAHAFNNGGQPLTWDTSAVTTVQGMFEDAYAFNQPLDWDTAEVTTMQSMFLNANAFNKELSNWNVGKVTSMVFMFYGNGVYNQPLFNLTTTTRDISRMFASQNEFDQDLSNWNTGGVNLMTSTFLSTDAFTGKGLDNWNTNQVTDMSSMFKSALLFNADLSDWDMKNVISINSMFRSMPYNGQIGDWTFTKLESLRSVFLENTKFNQDLSEWDTSTVRDFQYMFRNAESFNRDISDWNTDGIWIESAFSYYSTDADVKCTRTGDENKEDGQPSSCLGQIFPLSMFGGDSLVSYSATAYNDGCGHDDRQTIIDVAHYCPPPGSPNQKCSEFDVAVCEANDKIGVANPADVTCEGLVCDATDDVANCCSDKAKCSTMPLVDCTYNGQTNPSNEEENCAGAVCNYADEYTCCQVGLSEDHITKLRIMIDAYDDNTKTDAQKRACYKAEFDALGGCNSN